MIDRIIAHRGASAYAPENTIAAFDKAAILGARMIEFDVMLSQDGEPFVIHDENLKRTTNGRGEVGEVDAAYIKTLDAGKWFSKQFLGEKVPHLQDVLQWLIFSDMKANIEIKPYQGTMEATTVAVMAMINRLWPQNKPLPLVSSFDWGALHVCRGITPEMPLGLLMHEWVEQWESEASTLNVYSIHVNRKVLTLKRAQAIKEKGYKLAVYTVNSRRLANKLFDWGVDAIFSDCPDLLA
mgnify:CR=1 FL=1